MTLGLLCICTIVELGAFRNTTSSPTPPPSKDQTRLNQEFSGSHLSLMECTAGGSTGCYHLKNKANLP